jgi:hypothetical protein
MRCRLLLFVLMSSSSLWGQNKATISNEIELWKLASEPNNAIHSMASSLESMSKLSAQLSDDENTNFEKWITDGTWDLRSLDWPKDAEHGRTMALLVLLRQRICLSDWAPEEWKQMAGNFRKAEVSEIWSRLEEDTPYVKEWLAKLNVVSWKLEYLTNKSKWEPDRILTWWKDASQWAGVDIAKSGRLFLKYDFLDYLEQAGEKEILVPLLALQEVVEGDTAGTYRLARLIKRTGDYEFLKQRLDNSGDKSTAYILTWIELLNKDAANAEAYAKKCDFPASILKASNAIAMAENLSPEMFAQWLNLLEDSEWRTPLRAGNKFDWRGSYKDKLSLLYLCFRFTFSQDKLGIQQDANSIMDGLHATWCIPTYESDDYPEFMEALKSDPYGVYVACWMFEKEDGYATTCETLREVLEKDMPGRPEDVTIVPRSVHRMISQGDTDLALKVMKLTRGLNGNYAYLYTRLLCLEGRLNEELKEWERQCSQLNTSKTGGWSVFLAWMWLAKGDLAKAESYAANIEFRESEGFDRLGERSWFWPIDPSFETFHAWGFSQSYLVNAIEKEKYATNPNYRLVPKPPWKQFEDVFQKLQKDYETQALVPLVWDALTAMVDGSPELEEKLNAIYLLKTEGDNTSLKYKSLFFLGDSVRAEKLLPDLEKFNYGIRRGYWKKAYEEAKTLADQNDGDTPKGLNYSLMSWCADQFGVHKMTLDAFDKWLDSDSTGREERMTNPNLIREFTDFGKLDEMKDFIKEKLNSESYMPSDEQTIAWLELGDERIKELLLARHIKKRSPSNLDWSRACQLATAYMADKDGEKTLHDLAALCRRSRIQENFRSHNQTPWIHILAACGFGSAVMNYCTTIKGMEYKMYDSTEVQYVRLAISYLLRYGDFKTALQLFRGLPWVDYVIDGSYRMLRENGYENEANQMFVHDLKLNRISGRDLYVQLLETKVPEELLERLFAFEKAIALTPFDHFRDDTPFQLSASNFYNGRLWDLPDNGVTWMATNSFIITFLHDRNDHLEMGMGLQLALARQAELRWLALPVEERGKAVGSGLLATIRRHYATVRAMDPFCLRLVVQETSFYRSAGFIEEAQRAAKGASDLAESILQDYPDAKAPRSYLVELSLLNGHDPMGAWNRAMKLRRENPENSNYIWKCVAAAVAAGPDAISKTREEFALPQIPSSLEKVNWIRRAYLPRLKGVELQ